MAEFETWVKLWLMKVDKVCVWKDEIFFLFSYYKYIGKVSILESRCVFFHTCFFLPTKFANVLGWNIRDISKF